MILLRLRRLMTRLSKGIDWLHSEVSLGLRISLQKHLVVVNIFILQAAPCPRPLFTIKTHWERDTSSLSLLSWRIYEWTAAPIDLLNTFSRNCPLKISDTVKRSVWMRHIFNTPPPPGDEGMRPRELITSLMIHWVSSIKEEGDLCLSLNSELIYELLGPFYSIIILINTKIHPPTEQLLPRMQ